MLCQERATQRTGFTHVLDKRTVLQMFLLFSWQAILLLLDCRTSESTGVILRLPMVLDVIHTFTNCFVMSQASKGYGS